MKNFLQTTAYVLVLSLMFPAVGFSQVLLEKAVSSGGSSPMISTENRDGEWLRWDDGVNANAIGTSQRWWTGAILFETADLTPYDGWAITKIQVYQYDPTMDGEPIIKIWQGPNINDLTEYVEQKFSDQPHSWIEIDLEETHIIDASEVLVVGIE